MQRRPGFYRQPRTDGSATASPAPPRPTRTPTGPSSVNSQKRRNGARRTQINLGGFWVESVASRRFWRAFRRTNVGFQMSNVIPHVSPQCLSAYRNELESMSEIPRLNSRAREDGVRAWPPDPVFAPPARRTERPGDAPLRSRGPTRQNIHRPIRGRSRPRKVNRGSGQRSPGPPSTSPRPGRHPECRGPLRRCVQRDPSLPVRR